MKPLKFLHPMISPNPRAIARPGSLLDAKPPIEWVDIESLHMDPTDRFESTVAVAKGSKAQEMSDIACTPRHPVNREKLVERLNPDKLFVGPDGAGSSETLGTAIRSGTLINIAEQSEWFDFGRCDVQAALSATHDAVPILVAGLFILPFPQCVFRVRFTAVGQSADGMGVTTITSSGNDQIEVIYVCQEQQDENVIVPIAMNGLDADFINVYDFIIIKGSTLQAEKGAGKDDVLKLYGRLFLGLWVMLNTRNIPSHVDQPDEKLNRARVKSGKEPLRRVTRIDAATYVTALRETERAEREGEATPGGNRRSPKMHLRRAHLRYFTSGRFSKLYRKEDFADPRFTRAPAGCVRKDGTPVPEGTPVIRIHAMIINARDGVGPKRDAYTVEKK